MNKRTRIPIQQRIPSLPLLIPQGVAALRPKQRAGKRPHEVEHVPVFERSLVPSVLEQRAERVHDRGGLGEEVRVGRWIEGVCFLPVYLRGA